MLAPTAPPCAAPATAPTTPAPGRPRDARIDDAVLQATRDLLPDVGYLRLSISAIARRAGTTKPAIYRRWATKAHLVHEAVFPPHGPELALGGELRDDLRALVAAGLDTLARPAARAALPGLMAEMAADPQVHAQVLGRFADGAWGRLQERLDAAVAAGEARTGLTASAVVELIAGATLVATAIRGADDLGPEWVDGVVEIVGRGIAP